MNEKQILAQREAPLSHPPTFTRIETQSIGRDGEFITAQVTPFRTAFACVSLHMTDRIRLLKFPERDIAQIRDIIQQNWVKGIQDSRAYDMSQEFKLYGSPWSVSLFQGDQKLQARRLVMSLLCGLFDMGWVLKAAVDISKKEFDKDSLLFRLQQPPPPPCIWMCISFDQSDKISLINAPQDLGHAIVRAFGLRVQSHEIVGSVFRIKIRGYPWKATGKETVQARMLILIMLECLEQHGFSLYASLDQDNGPGGDSHASEADVWFCNRQSDWAPGLPIYHA